MVSEISVANMDDLAMFREIQKASYFIEKIKSSTVTDTELETPIVCLSAYYSHVNYTLLNARQLGTIDETVIIRQAELKRIARAMLQAISELEITEDLTIDKSRYERVGGIGFATTNGVLDETTF
jgi:hypothetical protein